MSDTYCKLKNEFVPPYIAIKRSINYQSLYVILYNICIVMVINQLYIGITFYQKC